MNWYFNINYFFSNKLWTIEQVKLAVELSKITETQYKEITSEDYTK
ncbi:XkdX family protein [Clostridioides mangenotii]|nr:XkdX family protein [Clostridioides mangenotii]MCR1955142.1 XkdX family protein [Clostridioides mangenotii]